MATASQRGRPRGSTLPWVLAALTLLAVVGAAFYGAAAARDASFGSLGSRPSAPGGEEGTEALVRRVVGLFPVLIAALSTLTIVAWFRERSRLQRRSRLLRRLNAATGLAGEVYTDIDLLELGAARGRDEAWDAFDRLSLRAKEILDEGTELRALVISTSWREDSGRDAYLTEAIDELADRAAALRRQAGAAAAELRPAHPGGSAAAGGTGDASGPGDPEHPFADGWPESASAIHDEFERAAALLGADRRETTTGSSFLPPRELADFRRQRVRFGRLAASPELRGDPSSATQHPDVVLSRREASAEALGAISALFTLRLARLERTGKATGAVAAARRLAEEQRGTARAPWSQLPGHIVTPDAYAAVAAEELRKTRLRERPEAQRSELLRGLDATVGSDGVLRRSVRGLGVQGTVIALVVTVSWSLAVGALAALAIARVVPASTAPAALPFLGLLAGLALALIPWAVTALAFAFADGGLVARRRERRRALARLGEVRESLAAVVARWDDTLLELAARAHDTPGSLAFASRREGLDAALDSALRSERALENAPLREQAEASFLNDVAVLGTRVKRLRARQEELLGGA